MLMKVLPLSKLPEEVPELSDPEIPGSPLQNLHWTLRVKCQILENQNGPEDHQLLEHPEDHQLLEHPENHRFLEHPEGHQ